MSFYRSSSSGLVPGFLSFTDEQAKEATEKYRERFADTGIYENKLYDGMKDFLEEATRQGRILMLATSKPTVFAKRILDYFDIARYFTFVAGSGLDGSFYTKGDVIRHVLESNNLTDHPSAVMIATANMISSGPKRTGSIRSVCFTVTVTGKSYRRPGRTIS